MKKILLALALALSVVTGADAACWQWSKTAATNATADSTINWAEGMAPSAVNDSARAMMARSAECRDDISGLLVTAGTSTAYTVTTNQGVGAPPQDGQQIVVRFNVANGVAATLAADGGTAYPIQTVVGTAVTSNTLQANGIYRLTFKLSSLSWLLQDFYNAPLNVNSVTYDKLQQVTASRLLGNATGVLANVAEIPLGANMSFVSGALTSSTDPQAILRFLAGFELSTVGSSTTYTVSDGSATDVAGAGTLTLTGGLSKTTASWAVGFGNGALDSGSIAINTWYHVFVIKRPDTGVVDSCISTSVTGCAAGAGNIPAAYTLKRRVGSIKTNASNQWLFFTQSGDYFLWSVHISETPPVCTTSSVIFTVAGVPTGLSVRALQRIAYAGGGTASIILRSPGEADNAPGGAVPDADLSQNTGAATVLMNTDRLTNLSAQLNCRATAVGASLTLYTYGWVDTRGK